MKNHKSLLRRVVNTGLNQQGFFFFSTGNIEPEYKNKIKPENNSGLIE